MRKVLLRFVFDSLWKLQAAGNELLVGFGWLLVFWFVVMAITAFAAWRLTRDVRQVVSSSVFWLIIPAFVLAVPLLNLPIARTGIPVFGYGFMLFVGFSSASLLAAKRIRTIGQPPDVIWDMMMWLLIPGLIGARINFFLAEGQGLLGREQGINKLIRLVALWDGGIVFYGAVIGGAIGLLMFCRFRRIEPIAMCDVIAPSLFVGEGFGRIGCFLYGCCFGRACEFPWAVRFPPDSLTYSVLLKRGTIDENDPFTIPLHPTQIYSSVTAFLLAALLSWYFRRRPFDGAVIGLAWILYPLNRFALEFFRDDTQLIPFAGVNLPLGQWVSLGLLVTGIPAMLWFSRRKTLTHVAADNPKLV